MYTNDIIANLFDRIGSFKTPIVIGNDNDYLDSLDSKFDMLIETFEEIHIDNFFIEQIKDYKDKLHSVIIKYYSGEIQEAQNIIENIIYEFKDQQPAISNINDSISFGLYNLDYKYDVQFFRARCSEKTVDYKREEMLHIPFSKRSLVKSGRFSIPGLPCLYLGTTSYVCWLELGRPADYMFNVSPVKLDNSQKIFNLAINFRDFCLSLEKKE